MISLKIAQGLFAEIMDLEKDKDPIRKNRDEIRRSIWRTALRKEFEAIPALVAEFEATEQETAKINGSIDNRRAKLIENGYSPAVLKDSYYKDRGFILWDYS